LEDAAGGPNNDAPLACGAPKPPPAEPPNSEDWVGGAPKPKEGAAACCCEGAPKKDWV
jgi:hypothetical protein